MIYKKKLRIAEMIWIKEWLGTRAERMQLRLSRIALTPQTQSNENFAEISPTFH